MIAPPWAQVSPRRAAGIFPIRTVPDPLAMVSGGPTAVGGARSGDTYVTVNVPGVVGDKQQVLDFIRQGLADMSRSGVRLGF